MTTAYDVPADVLVKRLAEKLKENSKIAAPEWAEHVKTGVNREMPAADSEWWFTRSASILRRLYIDGPVGVSRLRSFYGGRNRHGVARPHFAKGSGSVIRKIIQQLESAGFVTRLRSGRVASPAGRSLVDNTAHELKQELVKEMPAMAKY